MAGDQTLASLVALGAPSRPSLYFDDAPDDRPRVTAQDIADKGAVIVWPATDNAGRPPPEIARQFPDLAVEVPRAFARQFQGRMPLMRVGWGMVRPRVQASTPKRRRPPPVSSSLSRSRCRSCSRRAAAFAAAASAAAAEPQQADRNKLSCNGPSRRSSLSSTDRARACAPRRRPPQFQNMHQPQ